jgi:hypothetical protein
MTASTLSVCGALFVVVTVRHVHNTWYHYWFILTETHDCFAAKQSCARAKSSGRSEKAGHRARVRRVPGLF